MIIPQEENHIQWIDSLYAAYKVKPADTKPKKTKSKTITDAYQTGIKIEDQAIPIYESLVKNASDSTSASVLNTILYQTRMHAMMFNHALRMGMGMMN
jgi:rubrerythrin